MKHIWKRVAKTLAVVLSVCILLCGGVYAETASTALEAFNALTGQQAAVNNPEKSNAEYLTEIMAGDYATAPADFTSASLMAGELTYLTAITPRDIASFASTNSYAVAQVRNAYYIALANALRAEIMVNPAAEERYKNVQLILSLFLETDEANIDHSSREAIRAGMTPASAASIASEYSLPVDFVSFVIMDDDWDDDDWNNDDDWRSGIFWDDDPYEDSLDDLYIGAKDSASSTRIADMQERLIALGYLTGKADGIFGPATEAALREYQLANGQAATGVFNNEAEKQLTSSGVVSRWDYDNSFDNTPDNTPDYNTPDNTPDYNTPDRYNTPDYNTPDRYNTPDYNTPDNTPDYNTPDYNTPDNTPDYDNTP